MKKRLLSLTSLTIILTFLYIPILILIIFSFNDSRIVSTWKGFTFKYYLLLFQSEEIISALINTLLIGLFSTVISVLIGLLVALALEKKNFSGRGFMNLLIFLPLVMPDILMGISLALLFSFLRIQTGFSTVLAAHVTFCISYATIVIQSRLADFDYSLEEAAMDLGANRWEVFYKIKLPLLFPGILAAALLTFTLSIDDFIITFFTTGRGFNTLPIYIEGAIRRGTTTTINALSTLMIGFTLLLVSFSTRFRKLLYN